mmetsp:Transcript_22816/g.29117  ORF Transcript_22816/g.29117 Transcript_22816/m.29117 type:complete len:779 (-) Transcript_22816:1580-3916(-)
MSYSVCTIRIRPIRAEGLTSDNGAVENPLIVAQVLPWKTTRKSNPLVGGGADPSWKGSQTYIDLPYFGHPLPGVRAYVALMVMDKPAPRSSPTDSDSDVDEDDSDSDNDDDISAEMTRSDAPVFVGRADFDLRRYLQRRLDVHTLRLSLMDKKGNNSGEILCTLQFVLTGVVRLTVLSGSRLKSNVQEYPDQEPYVEGYLLPGKGKKKKTNHKTGENPRWGEYSRQPSLLGFASLGLFQGNEKPQHAKRRRQPHILDFKFKDNDRTEIPRIMINVKDKMDTALKQENAGKREREQIQKIENRIRKLKLERERENDALKAEHKPSSSGGWFFSSKKPEREIEEIPLSEEEKALVSRLTEKMEKQRREAETGKNGEADRLIGSGLIDIRPVLNYDGIREAKTITIDLVDENNMETGTLTCSLEFDNFAYDRKKEILKMPEFEDFTFATFLEMDRKQLANEFRKVYMYSEIQMEFVAPDFVIRAADQSGFPKTFIMAGFVAFTTFFLATLWLGLGTRTLSYSIGVLYPVYQSYKALEKRSNEMNQQWLTYWIVYGCMSALEGTVLRPFTFLYPTLFYVFKMMILLWLVNPNQLGATMLYHLFIAPWMRRHEGSIDKALATFNATAKEAAKDVAGIYDQLEEEMMMIHLDANNGQYNNSPTLPDDDPFGIVNAVKKAKRASKKRLSKKRAKNAAKGTRVFVALEEQKDNAKMILLKPEMSWDDVCLVAATTLGIAADVDLYMNINGTKVVVNSPEEIRENDLLFVIQPEKIRMQWVEKEPKV